MGYRENCPVMTAIATLTVAGVTRGTRYRVLGMSGGLIRIMLDDGTIGLRHIKAFNLTNI